MMAGRPADMDDDDDDDDADNDDDVLREEGRGG